MNASTTYPDPEQHWQELHADSSHPVGDFIKHAGDTLRRSPLLGIGSAAVVGFALGRILFGSRGSSGLTKLLAASAIPAASKGLHNVFDAVKDGASQARKATRKEVPHGVDHAARWLKSLRN